MNKGKNPAYVVRGVRGVALHADAIAEKFKAGKTMGEIARQYGVSRSRIQQILAASGLSAKDGGASKRAADRSLRALKARNKAKAEKCREKWGLSLGEWEKMRSRPDDPILAFREHQKNVTVNLNNTPFELSFVEWWDIWLKSGKWEQRGRGRYGMMCVDREKGFVKGNVVVMLQSNISRFTRLRKLGRKPVIRLAA